VHSALKPFEGRFRTIQQGEDACDLIVGVVGVAEGARIRASAVHTTKCQLRITCKCVKETLKAYDHRIFGAEPNSSIEKFLGMLPLYRKEIRLRRKVSRIFVRGILGLPKGNLFAGQVVVSIPNVNLNDAMANAFARVEGSATVVHGTSMIE